MHTKTDAELLRDYCEKHDEPAFGEIVRRYADFVYSAALRQAGSPENARDVAQVVFTQLARKAASFDASTILAGWLCRATRLVVLEQLRRDRRRLHRERQAMESEEPSNDPYSDWQQIGKLLDEGIAGLREEDRNALLLRFFRNESLTKIGAMLGVSEDAAQKRVARALVRLREFLVGRGINTTSEALSVTIATEAVHSAPAGLSNALTKYALGASTKGTFLHPLLKAITLSNMKTTMTILVCGGALVALAYQQWDKERLMRQGRATAEAQSKEITALRAAYDELSRRSNSVTELPDEARELLRLRAEVTRLRREQAIGRQATAQGVMPNSNTLPQAPERQILVTSKIMSLPVQDLTKAGALSVPRGGFQLMSDDQVGMVMEARKSSERMAILAEPRIQTANGVEAALASTAQVPLDGTNAEVGASVNITPHYTTNSRYITLDIHAQLSEVMAASQPEQQPALRVTDLTNSVTVADGQTIVLREDAAEGSHLPDSVRAAAAPQSFLVFLTPHLLDSTGTYERLKAVVPRKN